MYHSSEIAKSKVLIILWYSRLALSDCWPSSFSFLLFGVLHGNFESSDCSGSTNLELIAEIPVLGFGLYSAEWVAFECFDGFQGFDCCDYGEQTYCTKSSFIESCFFIYYSLLYLNNMSCTLTISAIYCCCFRHTMRCNVVHNFISIFNSIQLWKSFHLICKYWIFILLRNLITFLL